MLDVWEGSECVAVKNKKSEDRKFWMNWGVVLSYHLQLVDGNFLVCLRGK